MSIKALFVLDQVNRGGIEIQALDVARSAKEHGLELTIATTGGQLLDEFKRSGCEVIVLMRRFPIDIGYAKALKRIVADRNIQIVQGHQAVDGLHVWMATRRLRHVKRIVTIEGFIPDRKNNLTLKFLMPKMDAVIFPSQSLRDWVREHDGLNAHENEVVIPNGADPARMRSDGNIRKELGIESEAAVLGMIGNFYRDPRKDQLTLVKALPKVFAEFPNAHCLFVGKTEPGAEHKFEACKQFCIENGIAARVHFLGSRGDVPNILATLDVFVLSSLHEGAPIAILEALFAKVPVIASDIPPHAEYTQNAHILELFRTGDDDDLATKLIDVISNKEKSWGMADRAYDHALKNFSTLVRLESLRNLYERLLSE